jgi:lipid II:glycine glycyltransferase (peptidoglycan interpeptide bridge formation enzyme)
MSRAPCLVGPSPPAGSVEAAREGPGRHDWDRFVADVAGDLTQMTAWARVKEATGFSTVLAVTRRGGSVVGGALIVIKRLARLIGVGYVARGPLMAPGASDADIAAVLDEVERQARSHRLWHLIVQPPAGGEAIAAVLAARGYTSDAPDVSPSATLLIDLSRSLDAILADMSASRRRNIRQGLQAGLDIRPGSRGDIDTFHGLHAVSAQRQGFQPLSKAYLQAQWDALRPADAVELVTASHAGRMVAGIWLTLSGDTVTYRIPGWNGEEPRLQPNVACHWHAIRWAKQRGARHYDLGGIDPRLAAAIQRGEGRPGHDPQCPAAFKLGFGGAAVLLPVAAQCTLNPLVRPLVRACYARMADSRLLRIGLNRLRGP